MKHLVARTCTVVRQREKESRRPTQSSLVHKTGSRSQKSFRDESAYVLLGPPGSGKTIALQREAKRNGGRYITARDFLTFDPDPEWQGKTLFIDGLDEVRAGASEGRTPFDAIRTKLRHARRPRFRLSCREADWFGANDRERLKAVAPNGELLVLRLDPLSDQAVLEILEQNHGVDDPAAFVVEARKRGVEDLLPNPQNLRMLAEAVAEAGEWPTTRAETFDMACRKLVSEENPEHQIAWQGTVAPTPLLDGAGDLCALLLLAGKAGVTLPGTVPDTNHPRLDQVPRGDQQLLRRVVGTNLFGSPTEGRLVPVHRQVAEFVAARRLAGLIAEGLPVRRVLSPMTGFDGGIISEFRGLAAWLAAQSKDARPDIIERDPLGVVLYGDVLRFSGHEKRLLYRALKAETVRNPWLVAYASWNPPLAALVGREMEDDIRRMLADPARDEAQQSLLHLIVEAIRAAEPLPGLAEPLMAIVRDDSWPMMHRCAALEAYVQVRRSDPPVAAALRSLLDDVYIGVVPTQDDGLLGTLLEELYPDDLPAADLVGYLREPAQRSRWTRYGAFWTGGLIEKSTTQQMAQLLDLLRAPMEQVRAESDVAQRGVDFVVRPPVVLLRHLLERSPESVPQELLVYWLGFAGWLGQEPNIIPPGGVGDAEFFGSWLSDRPDMQKAMIEQGVSRCRTADGDFHYCMALVLRSLFGARLPEDYGAWCADQALRASNDEVADWFAWEAAAFVHNASASEDEQKEAIDRKLRDVPRLARVFEGRLAALEEQARLYEGLHRPQPAQATPDDGRFDEMRATVRVNLTALRANRGPPGLLHHLAWAYLDGFSDVQGETPEDRLRFLLGPDDALVSAALAGLRGAIHRADLPTWTEISKLAADGRIHLLAYPFMVGLDESSRAPENGDLYLSGAQTRLAVSIHFAVPRLRYLDNRKRPPRWLRICLEQEPDTVAEIWAHCARAQLRRGEKSLSDTHRLAYEPEYAQLARVASVPLLKAFPVDCRTGQLPILRSLLRAACLHGDRAELLQLIEKKLAYKSMEKRVSQRVYWLTAGLFVRPEAFGVRLESYVSGRGRRIQRLVEMTDRDAVPHALKDLWDATVLEKLIRLIGPYSVGPPDTGEVYSVTWPIQANMSVHALIGRLSEDSSDAARNALELLATDDRLVNWRSQLLDRLHRQRSVHREATFKHPGLEQVAQVLGNGRPANVADLWALTVDLLGQLAKRIRDGATSDWRQYWNVDKDNKPTRPKPENACRDALLSDLRSSLAPLSIDAVAEGPYADDKRSDIRVAQDGLNIPIEIKRSCHRDWWSAIRTQLIAKYTRDPGADGYGVYLVLWFGEDKHCRPVPASGRRPKSPDELRQALIKTLSDQERRKISVCVVDVSKPGTLT